MNYSTLQSLKVKIVFIFSLIIAIAFGINWQVATQTIHAEKVGDLEKLLNHLLIESRDEYIHESLGTKENLQFLYTIPHNILILKDSEANNVRFSITPTPYISKKDEVSASVPLKNQIYLNAVSDHLKIDDSVDKYSSKLMTRYLESLVIILIISFILLHYYMKPLGILAERTRTWKSTDPFEFSIPNAGKEIEELSKAFSTLVKRLEGFRVKEKALFKEMAHELKTPIALMRARLDVYESSDTISKQKLVTELGHDIERLMSELKNVLFFESTDFEDPTPIDIAEIIRSIVHKMDILIQRKELSLKVPNESFTVTVSEKLLRKAIAALIENAITYADEKSNIILEIDPKMHTLSILNQIGKDKYLFSSKIGEKMLRRISEELQFTYDVAMNTTFYKITLSFK